jgi:hypothetical protein
MNNNVIECKICNEKMMEFESNNPQPLLEDFGDRVCRDCNDYVTAVRILFRNIPYEDHKHISNIILNVMKMANSLKRSRLDAHYMYKELIEDE